MTRKQAFPLVCLFAFALVVGFPARSGRAQFTAGTGGSTTPTGAITMGTISILLTNVGKAEWVDTTYRTPINKAQCDNDEILHFALNNIPNTHKYLEIWVGDNCSAADRSTRIPDTGNCLRMASLPLTTGETTALTDVEVPPALACDPNKQGNRWIWFLAVDSEMSQTAANDFGAIQLAFDQDPPSAPANVKGSNGETQLEVKWTAAAGDPQYYHLIIDPMAMEGGGEDDAGSSADCSSSLMKAGDPIDPDALPSGLRKVDINERATSRDVDGRSFGGSMLAAVAVIADDLGRNHSTLSNIACLHVVKTKGFWETLEESGDAVEPGCHCSVPGARGGGLAAGLASGALGLIALFRRVRRRR